MNIETITAKDSCSKNSTTNSKYFSIYVFFVVGLLVQSSANATSHEKQMCIPIANGVPGTILWQKAPNWWGATADFPVVDQRLDAPSWRGASARTYPVVGSSIEDQRFRALHRQEGGKEYLYLSWQVKTAPNVIEAQQNNLWLGFSDPTTAGGDVAIHVELEGRAIVDGTGDGLVANDDQYTLTLWTKAKDAAEVDWTAQTTLPDWLNKSLTAAETRIWLKRNEAEGSGSWAVNMRIPVSDQLSEGVDVDTDFKMWYELEVALPTPFPATFPNWPRDATLVGSSAKPSPITNWGDVKLSTITPDPTCATGVFFSPSDIGVTPTTTSSSREIRIDTDPTTDPFLGPNEFFARPKNSSSAVNFLKARFRMANWGVNAMGNALPEVWTDIVPGGVPQPPAGIGIAAGSIDTPQVGEITLDYDLGACEKCRFKSFYSTPGEAANCDANCPAAENNTKTDHQCLLVELSGPGIDFLNDSVYRNMDFVPASLFEEDAEVNIKGIDPKPDGTMARDVYLYVDTINMPTRVAADNKIRFPAFASVGKRLKLASQATGKEDVEGRKPSRTTEVESRLTHPAEIDTNVDYEQLSKTMPTFRVLAYYDTGNTFIRNGVERKILEPMSSYGYFVKHDGSLVGWKHSLSAENLVELAPNFYKISVPESGVTNMSTRIEALEHALAFNARIGAAIPDSSLDTVVNTGLSLNLGIEYIYSPTLSLEGVFGYHNFADDGLGDDLSISQFSINGRYYVQTNQFRSFVNAGFGNYKLDPGSSESGHNFGVGIQHRLTSSLYFEAAFNRHFLNGDSPKPTFSNLQIGIWRLF